MNYTVKNVKIENIILFHNICVFFCIYDQINETLANKNTLSSKTLKVRTDPKLFEQECYI